MTLERVHELANAVKAMEEMKAQVISKEAKEEKTELQFLGIQKIQEYLAQIADAMKHLKLEVELPTINLYYLNKSKDIHDSRTRTHFLTITFVNGMVCFNEPAFASSLSVRDFCNVRKEEMFNIRNSVFIKDGESAREEHINGLKPEYVTLLSKWPEMKPLIEVAVEKELLSKMAENVNEVKGFAESYKKAQEFQA